MSEVSEMSELLETAVQEDGTVDGQGLVNRILPFSYVDGPGNRSAIFFQGCAFSCRYCHNPETQKICRLCGSCIQVCPTGALYMDQGKLCWDQEKCCGCDACIGACPNYSTPKTRWMTVDEIFKKLESALPFVEGITVSGGECTRYHGFLTKLFREAHARGKTAFADTNGQLPFRQLSELMEVMDQAMLDVKAWDPQVHRMLTGCGNETVLDNLDYLAENGKLFEVRTVIVPGYLNNEETVEAVSRKIALFPEIRYKLIKYRPWGVRPPMDVQTPSDAYMKELEALAKSQGVRETIIL